MGAFLHGWRRKVGCVTLVLACMVCTCWLRSFIVSDHMIMNEGTVIIRSAPNDLALLLRPAAVGAEWTVPWWMSLPNGPAALQSKDWTWQFCGFRYAHQSKCKVTAQVSLPDGRVVPQEVDMIEYDRVWVIPYWPITIPLTLLSAYLILWKPRKRTEPDHA